MVLRYNAAFAVFFQISVYLRLSAASIPVVMMNLSIQAPGRTAAGRNKGQQTLATGLVTRQKIAILAANRGGVEKTKSPKICTTFGNLTT